MSTAVALSVEAAPPAEPRRPRVLLVASALGAAASALVVLALLGAYLQVRGDQVAAGDPWLPEGTVLPLTPGNMGMVTLVMSCVTLAWAVYALRNQDRTHAYLAIGLTLVLGAAFINATAYLYQQLALPIAGSATAVLLYAVTGAHLAMTVAAMAFVVVMAIQALGGQLTGRDAEGLNAAALYWYATVAVYAVLWYGVYITK